MGVEILKQIKSIDSIQKAFMNPPEPFETLFMMDDPPHNVKRFECLEKCYINVTNYYYYIVIEWWNYDVTL